MSSKCHGPILKRALGAFYSINVFRAIKNMILKPLSFEDMVGTKCIPASELCAWTLKRLKSFVEEEWLVELQPRDSRHGTHDFNFQKFITRLGKRALNLNERPLVEISRHRQTTTTHRRHRNLSCKPLNPHSVAFSVWMVSAHFLFHDGFNSGPADAS